MLQSLPSGLKSFIVHQSRRFKSSEAAITFSLEVDQIILKVGLSDESICKFLLQEEEAGIDEEGINHLKMLCLGDTMKKTSDCSHEDVKIAANSRSMLAGLFLNMTFWREFDEDVLVIENFISLVSKMTGIDQDNIEQIKTTLKHVSLAAFYHLLFAIEMKAAALKLEKENHQKLIDTCIGNFRNFAKIVLDSEAFWGELSTSRPGHILAILSEIYHGALVNHEEAAMILCMMICALSSIPLTLDSFRLLIKPVKDNLIASLKNAEKKVEVELKVHSIIGKFLQETKERIIQLDAADAWLLNKMVFLIDVLIDLLSDDNLYLNAAVGVLCEVSIENPTSLVLLFIEEIKASNFFIRPPNFAAFRFLRAVKKIEQMTGSKDKKAFDNLESIHYEGSTRSIVQYLDEALYKIAQEKEENDSKNPNKIKAADIEDQIFIDLEVNSLVEVLKDCSKSFNPELLYCVSSHGLDRLTIIEHFILTNKDAKRKQSMDALKQNIAPIGSFLQTLRFMLRQRSF